MVICLIFANATKINIGMLIGALLLLVAAKDFFTRINRVVDLMVRYDPLDGLGSYDATQFQINHRIYHSEIPTAYRLGDFVSAEFLKHHYRWTL